MKTLARRKPGRPPSPAIRTRRREEILQAAARLFAEQGYAATAIQTLADRLRVGKGTVYRYFPTKRALFLAAVDRLMRQLHETISARIEGVADPVERIARGVRAYLDYFAERPEFAELLIQERAQFRERPQPTYFERRERYVGRWRELYAAMIAAGRVRPMPVERITEVIGDLLYGTMFTNYFTRRRRTPQEQAEAILDVVLHGILATPEGGQSHFRCAKIGTVPNARGIVAP